MLQAVSDAKNAAGTEAVPFYNKKARVSRRQNTRVTESEGFEPSSPEGLTHFECAPL